MTRRALTFAATLVLQAGAARGQQLSVEAAQTAGYSTESMGVLATQVRASGELASPSLRYFIEAAWGVRSASGTDAFGTAYPYTGRVEPIEAYVERTSVNGSGIFGVRAGRFRTPFGISGAGDHAYLGFLRAPLIRYDGYYALSNNYLEQGGDIVLGTPRLSIEAGVGTPGDVGTARRPAGADAVVRGQGAIGPLIVGASYITTHPYRMARAVHGEARFTGVDVRWMRGGVQMRGEWISGQPFDRTTTTGGYVDLIVHRPAMGAVTAVLRAEELDYEAKAPFALLATRFTAGARIRIVNQLALQTDIVHSSRQLPERRPTAVDVGLTWSVRRD